MSVRIHDSWKEIVSQEFDKPYFRELSSFLRSKKEQGVNIYPPSGRIFYAFDKTPFEEVKVVILGQDPYHGFGQAHGLAFSVPDGVPVPPSLKNIYKEIIHDCGGSMPHTGDLTSRAEQGVLLLNTVLTVQAGLPGSHQGKGWEHFTDEVIHLLSEKRNGLIFLLWGNAARSKKHLIDTDRHIILEAPHPSPFSAHKGFLGCQHFSTTNQLLAMQGKQPILWLGK